MTLILTFEIDLLSDYHIGAGHGLGPLVDSALHRDVDGRPVIRGTTVNGLLRDGLYRLLQLEPLDGDDHVKCKASGLHAGDQVPEYCGQFSPAAEMCPVCRVFGSPHTPKRWRISTARLDGLPIRHDKGWIAGETGALIAPHVRVSPRTRRAEERKLFFREEGDSRLTFRFTARCAAEDSSALEEAEWLVAAARLVRNLGAGRRRGRGECEIRLVEIAADGDHVRWPEAEGAQEWLLDRFERYQLHKEPRPATLSPVAKADLRESAGEIGPVRLAVVVRLDEPLIISEKAEAGNEFASISYIPGPALRGAFAGRIAAAHDLEAYDEPAYEAFADLFYRGGAAFSPLYPAHKSGDALWPAIPSPADLLSCELFPGFVSTGGHGAESHALRSEPRSLCPVCQPAHETKMEPWRKYLTLNPTGPYAFDVDRMTEMHLRVDPTTARAAEGDLFSYEALQPGQYFAGEVQCRDAAAWQMLQALTGLEPGRVTQMRIGRATRRGYGCVSLYLEVRGEDEPYLWCPQPIEDRVTDVESPLLLTLLSDTIVTDRRGRFQTGFYRAWLKEALGMAVDVQRSFAAARTVDGFHAYLGLPRWRDVALQAGSAAALRVPRGVSLADLRQELARIEREGIGLRRGEGFGRVAFNHPIYQACAGVADVSIPANRFDIQGGGSADALQQEDSFRIDWQEALLTQKNEDPEWVRAVSGWRVFRKPEFEVVARLLVTEAPSSATEVAELIEILGRPENLLPPELLESELEIVRDQKLNLDFFATDGQAGLKAVQVIAKTLEADASAGSPRWRLGLKMVADRIAQEAAQARKQKESGE